MSTKSESGDGQKTPSPAEMMAAFTSAIEKFTAAMSTMPEVIGDRVSASLERSQFDRTREYDRKNQEEAARRVREIVEPNERMKADLAKGETRFEVKCVKTEKPDRIIRQALIVGAADATEAEVRYRNYMGITGVAPAARLVVTPVAA